MDLLKIIQLGLTFSDDKGNLPPGTCTWQFNFKFNLKYACFLFWLILTHATLFSEDMYAQDSIDLLIRSGIDFTRNDEAGIDVSDFGELVCGFFL